jgi:hypothetical protein
VRPASARAASARNARREREQLDAALRWLARRQCSPGTKAPPPEAHIHALEALLDEVLREIARCPRRTVRRQGRSLAIRYTTFGRVLLIDKATGAVVASRYGVEL